jgi:large subunit ribosomal protein L25
VVYGHGLAPVHLNLPGHALMMALKTSNALLVVPIDGKDEFVLPKAVQREAIKRTIEHVDLLLVKRGEKVTVEIPVTTVGDVNSDGLLDQQLLSVSVETEATHIPTGIEVDVEGLTVGTVITAAQLPLPEGTTLAADAEAVILQVIGKPTEAPAEGEAAGENGTAEAAE